MPSATKDKNPTGGRVLSSSNKDQPRVRAGRIGAEVRWSDPANRRVLPIDDLNRDWRALYLARERVDELSVAIAND